MGPKILLALKNDIDKRGLFSLRFVYIAQKMYEFSVAESSLLTTLSNRWIKSAEFLSSVV